MSVDPHSTRKSGRSFEQYIDDLEKRLRCTQIKCDDACIKMRLIRQCYDEEHQFILDAKVQKCQLAECQAEIEQLKAQLAVAEERLLDVCATG